MLLIAAPGTLERKRRPAPARDWGGVPGWIGANAETRAAQGSGAPPAGRLRSEPFLCAVHETLRFTKLIGGSSVLHHNTDLGIHHSGLCACRRLTDLPSHSEVRKETPTGSHGPGAPTRTGAPARHKAKSR